MTTLNGGLLRLAQVLGHTPRLCLVSFANREKKCESRSLAQVLGHTSRLKLVSFANREKNCESRRYGALSWEVMMFVELLGSTMELEHFSWEVWGVPKIEDSPK